MDRRRLPGWRRPRERSPSGIRSQLGDTAEAASGGRPFQLLIMGGDQLYADTLLEVVQEIRRWCELPAKQRCKRAFTKAIAEQVESFYFDLYVDHRSQADPAAGTGGLALPVA